MEKGNALDLKPAVYVGSQGYWQQSKPRGLQMVKNILKDEVREQTSPKKQTNFPFILSGYLWTALTSPHFYLR